jgi:AraC-like DNA-binding protein
MSNSVFYELNRQALRVFYGQNLTFYSHFHSSLELFLSLEGQTKVAVEDKEKLLPPGEVAVIWPNYVHSYTAVSQTGYLIAIADLSLIPEYAPTFAKHDCLQPFLDKEKVHPDVLHCLNTLARSPDMSKLLRRAYLSIIAGRLLEQLPLGERKRALLSDALRDLMTFIDSHISEPISLDLLSKELYLNKYYISKLFSQRIGCSLRTYINAIRIDRACSLLANPGVTIPDVLEACGFESERTFYRAFVKQRGMTPKAFRMQPQGPGPKLPSSDQTTVQFIKTGTSPAFDRRV